MFISSQLPCSFGFKFVFRIGNSKRKAISDSLKTNWFIPGAGLELSSWAILFFSGEISTHWLEKWVTPLLIDMKNIIRKDLLQATAT